MTVAYVDRQNGNDTTNPLGTESAPRFSWPTMADGMVIRLKRGSTYAMTGQQAFSNQGMIITDYGDPSLPRPILSNIHAASTSSFPFYGDTIFANIQFDLVDRTGTETTASNVGQNCVTHGRRGNAASPAKLVSAVYLGCGFSRIGGDAIRIGSLTDGEYADAAPVVMVLGCDFDYLGNDAIYGSVSQYLEVAHCTARNFGQRANSNSDFVNLLACSPEYVFIHDNYADHTTDDRKHVVVLDMAAGQTGGLAVIERNIFNSFGANAPFAQATANAGLNLEMRSIVRNNYLRGSRLLVVTQAVCPSGTEVYSNILDSTGSGAINAATLMQSPDTAIFNNTYVARNRTANTTAAAYVSTATGARNFRNLYVGFDKAISTSSSRSFITGGSNRFAGVGSRYWSSGTSLDLADGTDDAVVAESSLLNQYGVPIKPPAGTLVDTMARLDRRVPDFWGRFAPEGVGYIGALMERGL